MKEEAAATSSGRPLLTQDPSSPQLPTPTLAVCMMASPASGEPTPDKAKWTDEMTGIYLRFVLNEIEKGNFRSGAITSDGWDNVLCEFKIVHNFTFIKKQLTNKWTSLKTLWSAWLTLKHAKRGGVTRIRWNNELNIPDCTPQQWNRIVLSNPKLKPFKDAPIPHEDLMMAVFGDKVSTRSEQLCLSEPSTPSDVDPTESMHSCVGLPLKVSDDGPPLDDMLAAIVTNPPNNSTQQNSQSCGPKRSYSEAMREKMKSRKQARLKSALHVRARLEALALSRTTRANQGRERFDECVKRLRELDVSPTSLTHIFATTAACRPSWVSAFLAQPSNEAAIAWLNYNLKMWELFPEVYLTWFP